MGSHFGSSFSLRNALTPGEFTNNLAIQYNMNYYMKKMCKQTLNGELCKFREKCIFAHNIEEIIKDRQNKNMPFKVFECKNGLNCDFEVCNYAHYDTDNVMRELQYFRKMQSFDPLDGYSCSECEPELILRINGTFRPVERRVTKCQSNQIAVTEKKKQTTTAKILSENMQKKPKSKRLNWADMNSDEEEDVDNVTKKKSVTLHNSWDNNETYTEKYNKKINNDNKKDVKNDGDNSEIVNKKHSNGCEELLTEKSLTEEPLTEKSLTEEPLTEKSLTEEPLTEKSLTEEPLNEKSLTEEPLNEKSLTEEPLTEKSLTEEQLTEKSLTKDPPTEEDNSMLHKQYIKMIQFENNSQVLQKLTEILRDMAELRREVADLRREINNNK
jgi:hypothetical protein